MKKIYVYFSILVWLCGCTAVTPSENVYNGKYENYIELIINNNGVVSADIPFDYEFTCEESNGEYIYDVDIFNPRVAMYDVEMIAVDRKMITDEYLAPSLGVAEETQFNMIPNQSDSSLGYYQRLGLNGLAPTNDFTLYMLVTYKDSTKVNEKMVFFTISAAESLPTDEVDEIEDTDENSDVTDEENIEDMENEEE